MKFNNIFSSVGNGLLQPSLPDMQPPRPGPDQRRRFIQNQDQIGEFLHR